MHIELITTLTIVNLPALFIRGAFQVGMLAETLSISGCKCVFLRRPTVRGRPKYWIGNSNFCRYDVPDPVDLILRAGYGRYQAFLQIGMKAQCIPKELQHLLDCDHVLNLRCCKQHHIINIERALVVNSCARRRS